ncbi:hypothetical protein PTSG_10745 [Salpingoeca rosetta]|uniref:AMP-dependent synthetase/ligase domain-containing protein n=1 Tax=Salpingoeca rosetta (strain ATCC 50818 / BSB-021) TaxID=946362 RepID=F2UQ93_SALR5|nr:uncharacterized protein PTSG_10745 [Salpingoeca rosetta]EGD79761.1 hypothetical protein PTSG_10745 [Salpingoeca rosetta]|eukprot:XP_004988710.1 hypothetical protein PTSG_10745 [Salpingoeca rosetta]
MDVDELRGSVEVDGGQRVSNVELRAGVEKWAATLQEVLRQQGLAAAPCDARVRVAVVGSVDMSVILAILAVWKAGHSAVPIAASTPWPRAACCLELCSIVLVAGSAGARCGWLAHMDLLLDALPQQLGASARLYCSNTTASPPPPIPDELHVYHTSGTTGRPKPVVCTVGAMMHYVNAHASAHGYDSSARVLVASALSFDPFVGEVITTLVTGGTLVVVPRDVLLQDMQGAIARHRITHVMTTPSIWSFVQPPPTPQHPTRQPTQPTSPTPGHAPPTASCPPSFPLHLRAVMLGGEPLSPAIISTWCDQVALYNVYGTTEGTVYQFSHRCTRTQQEAACIGRPLDGVDAFLLPTQAEEYDEDEQAEDSDSSHGCLRWSPYDPSVTQGVLAVGGLQLGAYLSPTHPTSCTDSTHDMISPTAAADRTTVDSHPEHALRGGVAAPATCTHVNSSDDSASSAKHMPEQAIQLQPASLPTPLPRLPARVPSTCSGFFDLHGRRVYVTGDIVRRSKTPGPSRFVYVGRNDDQVKVSGQRVSLVDIDMTIRACPLVESCKCIFANRMLQLHVCIRQSCDDPIADASSKGAVSCWTKATWHALAALRLWISAHLPAHMVPASIHAWPSALPRTPNDKIDTRALQRHHEATIQRHLLIVILTIIFTTTSPIIIIITTTIIGGCG